MNTDNGHDAEESTSASYRRIWKRRDGSQGSSQLALNAMAVLYDAGQPLSRNELASRLLPRLDAYARAYLEAWYGRRRDQIARAQKRPINIVIDKTMLTEVALRTWLTNSFFVRAKGGTLIRDPDGRYRPGPRAPIAVTMDGDRKAFTPTVRHELEQADHDRSRAHAAVMELTRVLGKLDLAPERNRVQIITYLLRRFYVGTNSFDERRLNAEFKHLLQIADTADVMKAVLRHVFDALVKP